MRLGGACLQWRTFTRKTSRPTVVLSHFPKWQVCSMGREKKAKSSSFWNSLNKGELRPPTRTLKFTILPLLFFFSCITLHPSAMPGFLPYVPLQKTNLLHAAATCRRARQSICLLVLHHSPDPPSILPPPTPRPRHWLFSHPWFLPFPLSLPLSTPFPNNSSRS